MPPIVYLAGPIAGVSWDDANGWRRLAQSEIGGKGIRCLSPLRGKEKMFEGIKQFKTTQYEGVGSDSCIYDRDRSDLERADIVLAHLRCADRVSIGTMFELGWASTLHKFIVVVMDEGNVHDHPFVRRAASLIVPTLDEACQYIIRTLQPLT